MRSRELDRMLELADELIAARLTQRRMAALETEIAHERSVITLVPQLANAVSLRREAIEQIARGLETQWVDQGPLVSLWQRAVELAELAEGSGADGAEYRAGVEEARLRVEKARLVTRDTLELLCGERAALADVLLDAPFELPTPPPVRDDGRPEAARRDALQLAELAGSALATIHQQRARATAELDRACQERAELGDAALLEARIASLQRELPEIIELPPSAPPSVANRLQRAGLRVTAGSPA